MLRSSIVFATGALLLASCAGTGPRIQTGPDAVKSPDGLHRVDGVVIGTLFMRPDYAFGTYEQFVLGNTDVTFRQGSRVLDAEELGRLVSIFETVARTAITGTGRGEAKARGPCIAYVKLALIDLALEAGAGGGTASIGAVTLVLEIRDGHTMEPLLRYGQRRRLSGLNLTAAFERYATRFQREFQRALPSADPASPALSCAERARETG